MSQPSVDEDKLFTASSQSCYIHDSPHCLSQQISKHGNVLQLLASREISPREKRPSKRFWGKSSRCRPTRVELKCAVINVRHALLSWVEAESLRCLSAKYCSLLPPPRSTIAAAFSSDGKTLASTHGDHTVKIIDCQTGRCLKVLSGHRRTPWVVRFHPFHQEILASGSLDHEVRLWNARTAECLGSRDFYRPIASIAFHARGGLLAVASGHKLYIWNYDKQGEVSSPSIVLKTRRSLRAVHFHPHAAPFLLTAEVNDLDSSDSPLTLATSPGYLFYQPPVVFPTNLNSALTSQLEPNVPFLTSPYFLWPSFIQDDSRSFQHGDRITGSVFGQRRLESSSMIREQTYPDEGIQFDQSVVPMEISSVEPSSSDLIREDAAVSELPNSREVPISDSVMENLDSYDSQPTDVSLQRSSGITSECFIIPNASEGGAMNTWRKPETDVNGAILHSSLNPSAPVSEMFTRNSECSQFHQFVPLSDPACWELPFLQGWLMGQSQAGLHVHVNPSIARAAAPAILTTGINSADPVLSSALSNSAAPSRGNGQSGSRHRSRTRLLTSAPEDGPPINSQNIETELRAASSGAQSQISASLAAAAELPCTVKLRIWSLDIQDPCAPLDPETCRLTIPHAVLCSEMGAHFSPCGRFLAACVACVLPHMESDSGLQSQMHLDSSGSGTSPTRHPVSAHQVMYELRIYSLEEATFGSVLTSRAIRAAHCLTSIQFSPTSEHILLAYGRRHNSLLRSFLVEAESTIPIYTILEVYRVSDMELVRVLPSADDEVNVACFHPIVGEGIVYGTKEGKLRILQFDGPYGRNFSSSNIFLDENVHQE